MDVHARMLSLLCVRTQRCIEADTHQVKPVAFHILSSVEHVLAPLKWFIRWLCDQPVVRLSVGGVNNSGIAFQINKDLDFLKQKKNK